MPYRALKATPPAEVPAELARRIGEQRRAVHHVAAAFGGIADAWAPECGWRVLAPAGDAWCAIVDRHYAPTAKGAHARAATRDRVDGAASAWAGRLEAVAWDWYATLTWRESVHPEAAQSGATAWLEELATHARQALAWVLAWEWQARGVLHAHLLICNVPRRWRDGADARLASMRLWERLHRNHGFARVERFEGSLGAGGYLAKYVVKDGALDLGVAVGRKAPRRGRRRGGRRERRVGGGLYGGRDVVRALSRR